MPNAQQHPNARPPNTHRAVPRGRRRVGRALQRLGLALAVAALALALLGGALYVASAGDHGVPATTADDPDLPRVEIDGYPFHAEVAGTADAPVVIVLHGGPGGDYRSLLALRELAGAYRVVFYDQRGSGLSPRVPAEELDYRGALDDLDAFVERFGGDRPVRLIGHSWGAILAAGYLGRAPEKVERIVMIEPGFLDAEAAAAWRARRRRLLSGPGYRRAALLAGFAAQRVDGPDAHAQRDFLEGERILPYFAGHPDNPYHCPGRPYDAPSWRWGAAASRAIEASLGDAELDALPGYAAAYDGPVLFLAGACNTWIGPELQAEHAVRYPRGRLEVIADAGHDVVWDQPEATLVALRAFLAGGADATAAAQR